MKRNLKIFVLIAVSIGAISLMKSEKSVKVLASESYNVIRVNGKIVFNKTKASMKLGDKYFKGTPITFGDNQSRAAIINKIRGRCVLSPSVKGKAKILPAINNVNSRGGALINKIDLINHFNGQYLVLGKMELEISDRAYPQSKKSFFYLSYSYKDEIIRKKLPYNGNKLILDREEIFKIDGKPIAVQDLSMALYYMDNTMGDKICEFKPVFPDLNNLKLEVEIIMAEYDNKDKTGKVEGITSYLNEFYGKPQKDNLIQWLEGEFTL